MQKVDFLSSENWYDTIPLLNYWTSKSYLNKLSYDFLPERLSVSHAYEMADE